MTNEDDDIRNISKIHRVSIFSVSVLYTYNNSTNGKEIYMVKRYNNIQGKQQQKKEEKNGRKMFSMQLILGCSNITHKYMSESWEAKTRFVWDSPIKCTSNGKSVFGLRLKR